MEYQHAQIALVWSDPAAVGKALNAAIPELGELGLTLGDLEFAVILSSSYLRILEFRHRMSLTSLEAAGNLLMLTVPERPQALQAWRSGCTLEVSIHLSVQKPAQVLKPWRLGAWVARTSWVVETEAGFTGFTPKPLTAAKKSELKLAPKTMRYITLNEMSPLDEEVSEDAVEMWLDADLLAKIAANPRSKPAIALQRQLFVDAVSVIVNEVRLRDDFDLLTWPDIEKSLLGRVISLVTPNNSSAVARAKAAADYLEILKANPARFVSHVEEAAQLLSSCEAGLDG
jgi:hypothetical protein